MAGIVMLVVFFAVILFLKVPMAIGLLVSAIVGMLAFNITDIVYVGKAAFESLYSFTTLALPLYIFAGVLMSRGGIAKQLCDFCYALVSKIVGGLAIVNMLASAFFAAISGSSTATTIAIGGMMYPEMVKKGYDKDFSLAVAAAGGVIGPIIPPSIGFILYGVCTGTSISDLFLGGVIPGLMMLLFMSVVAYFICRKKGYKGENITERRGVLRSAWEAKWALLVPVIILGGIYSGKFTPTEAGAVACVYSIIVSTLVLKTVKPKELFDLFAESTVSSAAILILVATATIFGRVLTLAQVPQTLTFFILSLGSSKFTIMLLINVFLLIVGCVMEASAAIMILSPLLLPVAASFGFSPLQFGVILVSNLTIGAITPPVGCCLFAASVIGERPVEKIAKAALPFLAALLVVLALTCVFPGISEWLPGLLSK